MKRKIIIAFLALVLCLSMFVSVSAASDLPFLIDEADILTDAEELTLDQRLAQISQTYGAQVTVVTLASLDDLDIDMFVEYFYDEMDLGYGENHDGVLLMISMDPRQYRILSNGMAAEAITADDIDDIGDLIVGNLSDGYYADAFGQFADECEFYLDGYINGFPFPYFFMLLVAAAIGLVVGLIAVLIMRGKLKSVGRQYRAADYVKAGSLQLNICSDRFLYRNITRTKRETKSNSSGSSSGSSRNVGGGSF